MSSQHYVKRFDGTGYDPLPDEIKSTFPLQLRYKECRCALHEGERMLPLSAFGPDARKADGLKPQCKQCHGAASITSMKKPRVLPEAQLCTVCGVEKPVSKFYRIYNTVQSWCKSCVAIAQADHYYNGGGKEVKQAYRKEWYENNGGKEKQQACMKEWYENNGGKEKQQAYRKDWLANGGREKVKEWLANGGRELKTKRHQERYATDPDYKMAGTLRGFIKRILGAKDVGFDGSRLARYAEVSPTLYRMHLESLFYLGMAWTESAVKWEIDHVARLVGSTFITPMAVLMTRQSVSR